MNDRDAGGHRLIETGAISARARYQLLTSLVVPRPIGWLSTRSRDGVANLAPFSFYAALSATPMLVGVSIGERRGSMKDTLHNIRDSGAFCVNLVSEALLPAMNESAAEHAPEVDEFDAAGVPIAEALLVPAPFVGSSAASLECRLYREVDLGAAAAAFVIGEVLAVRLREDVPLVSDTHLVPPELLRPVARLGGDLYARLGEIVALPRPRRSQPRDPNS